MSTAQHSHGMKLSQLRYPRYFQAIETEGLIAASDAHTDNRTQEFSDSYLTPFSIYPMLDVPIYIEDQIVGVICLEHTQTKKNWVIEEQNFASYYIYDSSGKRITRSQTSRSSIENKSVFRPKNRGYLSKSIVHI